MTGFAVDLLEHGVAEEIASLVVVLRLWRFVKIVDEFSVEASEQTEELRRRIGDLEKQNRELRARVADRGRDDDHREDEAGGVPGGEERGGGEDGDGGEGGGGPVPE